MVHALKEAWRVIRGETNNFSNGPPYRRGLLDIRPRTSDPMIYVCLPGGREELCGPLTSTSTSVDKHSNAERAVKRAVDEGWFRLSAQRDFDWVDEYDTADDLVESIEEDWSSRSLEEDVALNLIKTMENCPPSTRALIKQRIGVRILQKAMP